jgi:hypothetical protein
VEDLPEPGGDRAEGGPLDPRRQLDRGEPLGDLLPREPGVGPVGEPERHLREPEPRERAELLDPRQARQRLLDGHGELALGLDRPERRGDGVHLHLHRRRVREGVDGQRAEGERARHGDDDPGRDHDPAVPERPVDDARQHGSGPQ